MDVYRKVRNFTGSSQGDCPFRYQGQYEDEETGLYYNRFRYYDPSTGSYLSQDPIGLAGNNPTLYGYVKDVNNSIDALGLNEDVQWSNHGNKHVSPPINNKTTWNDVVKSTKNGPAKYLPGTNIEALERDVWKNGTLVTNGKNWKVAEFDHVIGASGGKETRFMRVENSANTIHGHPITEAEYKKLTKCH